MLWLALHFPSLPLEIFSRGSAESRPLVVAEKRGNRTLIVACNADAAERGVCPGMMPSAAEALAQGLVVRTRDVEAEHAALEGLAEWAGQFTPGVSLQPPAGLVLEVGSCLTLHRGLDRLRRKLRRGLDALAYTHAHACAPTPHGAWLLARAGLELALREPAQLEAALAPLPTHLLDLPESSLATLELIGAATLGDCLRLPRAGLARRFGPALLDPLDRAFGRVPEARTYFIPPPCFNRRLELPAPVQEAEALLFAARRLLPELEGYLTLRQAGVQNLELVCRHDDHPDTVVTLGFVKPVRAAARMLLLLRETLARTALPAPVESLRLHARDILPLPGANTELFSKGRDPGDGHLLLERLRVRLGADAVFGVAPAADHRPERAWRRCDIGSAPAASTQLPRPLWLLPQPRPCRDGGLVLKDGPERIESGWWDGREATRDYYVAQDRHGVRLWVYCERTSGEWFVHGLFA